MSHLPQRIPTDHSHTVKFARQSVAHVAAVADAVRWWAERDRVTPAAQVRS